MSRETIANFLTAERKVSPLMAFSLLITAGFIAGSLQLVAPQNQNSMMAVAAGSENSTGALDSQAPDNCTDAIKIALGKTAGPPATTVDQGQAGTADACFGGVLADPMRGVPSQNPADYKCVGRTGRVTITSESAITTTQPDPSVQMGKCKVQVCQPITTIVDGKPSVNPNCGEPKQFSAGQNVTAQSGGVPSLPSVPTGGSSGGTPSAPQPNQILTATNGQLPSGESVDFKNGVVVEANGNQIRVVDNNTGNIANLKDGETVSQALERMGNGQSDINFHGNPTDTKSDVGAILNQGTISDPYYSENAAAGSNSEGGVTPGSDQPGVADYCAGNGSCVNGDTKPQQTTTFSPGGGSPGEVDFPVDTVADRQKNEQEKPEGFWGSVKSSASSAYNWVDEKVKAGGQWVANTLGYGSPSDDEIRAAGLEPANGSAQNPTLATSEAPQNSTAGSDPEYSEKANDGKYSPGGVVPGTDQPGVNTDKIPAGVVPGTDQPGVSEVCKNNPAACGAQTGTQTSPGWPQSGPAQNCPGGPGCPGGTVGLGGGEPTNGGIPSGQNPNPVNPGYCVVSTNPLVAVPCQQSRSSSSGNGITSFLTGLLRGMSGMLGTGAQQQQAGTCPTDPQAYAQYQQQYNMQLQQYNQQLQQYNYQQQMNYQYGYSSYGTPPQPPVPCQQGGGGATGTGGGAGTGGICQPLPSQPDPASCPIGAWRPMTTTLTNGNVCPVWQCVAATSTTPTAQLSCDPSVAENGSKVTISYTCTNAKSSTGFGFVTGGATAGATSTIVNAPANASGMNFALRCENGQVTAAAQCSVQLAKISISLRVVPERVRLGDPALIGWVTTGMESCVVSSPDQPEFTERNASIKKVSGIATSSPITEKTDFYLNCTTVTGGSKQEMITVDPYRIGTVSSSLENRTDLTRGSSASIQWSFPSAPDVSAVALWLYSVEDQRTVALISGRRAKAGAFSWNIPEADSSCNRSSSLVCGSDMIPGRSYQIIASLYTPPNASLGEFNDSTLPEPTFLDNPSTKSFKFAQ